MLRIERERERMLLDREKVATALVQRIWRGKIGRAVAQARDEELERARRVAAQMEEHADAMKLENLVYEDKVKREFAVEAQAKHVVEARKPVDAAAKRDIVVWRRKQKRKQWKVDERKEWERKEAIKQEKIKAWKKKWKKLYKERVEANQEELSSFLAVPSGDKVSDARRLKLLREIEKDAKELVERYKDVGLDINIEDANSKAKENWVEAQMEEYKVALDKEKSEDEAKLWEGIREVEQREWEEAQVKIEEDTLALAVMLQCQWRVRASKKALRARMEKVWVKEFDKTLMLYRYRNTLNGRIQHRRPLRTVIDMDLDPVDCWMTMRDKWKKLYFFRPANSAMVWEAPDGTVMCEECQQQFASRRCIGCRGSCYCGDCYEHRHALGRRREHEWREMKGGLVLSGTSPAVRREREVRGSFAPGVAPL